MSFLVSWTVRKLKWCLVYNVNIQSTQKLQESSKSRFIGRKETLVFNKNSIIVSWELFGKKNVRVFLWKHEWSELYRVKTSTSWKFNFNVISQFTRMLLSLFNDQFIGIYENALLNFTHLSLDTFSTVQYGILPNSFLWFLKESNIFCRLSTWK